MTVVAQLVEHLILLQYFSAQNFSQTVFLPFRMKTLYFGIGIISFSMLLNLFAEMNGITSEFLIRHLYSEVYNALYPFPHKVVRCNMGGVPLYYLLRDIPMFNLQHLLSNVGVGITFTLTGLMSLILFTNIRVIPLVKDFRPIKVKKRKVLPPVQKAAPISMHTPEIIEEETPSDLKITTHHEKWTEAGRVKNMDTKSYSGTFKRYRLPPP